MLISGSHSDTLLSLRRADVGSVYCVSEVNTASVFRVKWRRMWEFIEFLTYLKIFCILDYTVSKLEVMMKNELERIWKEAVVA
jgi:hypothetical protein